MQVATGSMNMYMHKLIIVSDSYRFLGQHCRVKGRATTLMGQARGFLH